MDQLHFMKRRNRVYLFRCGLVLCAIAGLSVIAEKKALAPDPKDIARAWFGIDQDRLTFCRLELNQDGKGLFSTTFVENPARLYVVEKWSLDGFNLTIDLKPVDEKAEPIYLKGLAGLPELVLEMGGTGDKTWKRQLRLFNEQDFLSKNERVKARIEKYKAEQNAKLGK